MRLLVTGKDGQVARSLAERAAALPDIELVTTTRAELDLERPETVAAAIAAARPDIVVSAAAYTAVDRAEDEPGPAFAINATGAGAVAAAAAAIGAPIIHLSTDYVFSGDKPDAYQEGDATGPRGVYGRSKLAGEETVAAANPRHVILRTAWVYSPFGRNFVATMLALARDRDSLRVVADQQGNPTSALDIADGILHVAASLGAGARPEHFGVFHLAGSGDTSWSGFAREIFAASGRHGGPTAEVVDIATQDYPTRATRPANSRLRCDRLEQTFGWRAPAWQDSCDRVVARLLAGA